MGTGLRLTAGEAEAAGINRELVAAGVEVSELRREERSLEEVFLEMTTRKESDDDAR